MREAVIEFKGFQYKVKENDVITTQRLGLKEGDTLEIDSVMLLQEGDRVVIGKPYIEKAKVIAKVLKHYKADKVIAFRFVNKENVRKKRGHRQELTELKIEKILTE
jgi:large subunit ribosomal protein L21